MKFSYYVSETRLQANATNLVRIEIAIDGLALWRVWKVVGWRPPMDQPDRDLMLNWIVGAIQDILEDEDSDLPEPVARVMTTMYEALCV